jgi:hypothetical protein
MKKSKLEGRVSMDKGGVNTEYQITKRPPPPAPMKAIKLDADPYTSLAGVVVGMAPPGYQFDSYVRSLDKVTVTYIKKTK